MARKKKRVYSTKTTKAPVADKVVADTQDPESIVEEIKEVVEDPRFTLDEAIGWFKNDPHQEEFFCPETPGFALASGNHYLKFNAKPGSTGPGYFRTSDPAEVEILMRSREFNLFIFATNPILRNLKK
jgi:hypothetical protein